MSVHTDWYGLIKVKRFVPLPLNAEHFAVSRSSRGLGHRPFTAVTGVRLPYGIPLLSILTSVFKNGFFLYRKSLLLFNNLESWQNNLLFIRKRNIICKVLNVFRNGIHQQHIQVCLVETCFQVSKLSPAKSKSLSLIQIMRDNETLVTWFINSKLLRVVWLSD